MRNSTLTSPQTDRTPAVAVSAIRNWWNTHQLDKSDSNASNTEEDEEDSAGRKLLSANLHRTLRTRQLLVDFDAGRPILSLKAPPDLVNFPSISRPRWPIECEVISDVIDHIEWDPPEPEPFYQSTRHERTPPLVGEERGKVVYCIDQATRRPFFTCSRVGGSRGPVKSATCDIGRTDVTLEFESRFESGNLQKAVQVGPYDYELTLRTDMYTRKNTQWFYFRVRNTRAGATYRFTIINLMKSSSLYSQGMRPLLYSQRAAEERGVGWHRAGSNITYYRTCSQNSKDKPGDTVTLYSLTWTLRFPHDSDTCYLAHCYPYTYSRLQRYLRRVSSDPAVAPHCKLRVLCHSLAGNAVYVVTVTSRGGGAEGGTKKVVVVTARVHPGETNGSWMMEGLLDFLLGDSEDAQLLRDTFVFKVVPMLNPDGVIVGNYRCSLAGRDLNRNYKTMLRDSFPCVWHTRKMVERLVAETDVVLYCDFHGHNRKSNVFMYGCNSQGSASLKLHERVFPLMMSKNASNKFSFKSCKFRVQRSKEGTGRVAMWRLGIKHSYTLEATFGGSTLGDRKGSHFTTRDLKSIGFYFCDTLLDFCDPDSTKTTYCLTELAALLRKKIRERLGRDLSTDCKISVSDLETSTSGSNSSDSDGLPAHLLSQPPAAHAEQTATKKKRKRLRRLKERNALQATRARNHTQPRVLQKNTERIESDPPRDDTVRESTEERPVRTHRKTWQMNGLIRNLVVPSATAHSGEVSQVTLWQGCEPVKDGSLGDPKAANRHRRAKACPHVTPHTVLHPLTDDPGVGAGRCRCPPQLLHLSALLPPSTHFIHPTQRRPPGPRHSSLSCKVCRGLPHPLRGSHRSPSSIYLRMVPDVAPTKRLLSSFATDTFNVQRVFRDRNSSGVPERRFVAEEEQQNAEQEEDSSEGSSLLGQQNRRDLKPEAKRRSSLFLPTPRGPDRRGELLCKETLRNKRHMETSSTESKPSDLRKTEPPRPPSDTPAAPQDGEIRHCDYHSGGESQTSAPQEAAVTRSSQSAPL